MPPSALYLSARILMMSRSGMPKGAAGPVTLNITPTLTLSAAKAVPAKTTNAASATALFSKVLLLYILFPPFGAKAPRRSKALRRLVQDEHAWPTPQGDGDRQHLLLATTEHPGHGRHPLPEDREQPDDEVENLT